MPLFRPGKRAALFVHFPCFDGIVSGALALVYLQAARGWNFTRIEGVNYERRSEWLLSQLPGRAAVVDFLYHPQAEFWADHHVTAFASEQLQAHFESRRGPSMLYDREAASCSSLLWRTAGNVIGPDARLEEMVAWAGKIDDAAYSSVEEALSVDHPALALNRSLAIEATQPYCAFLVRQLGRHDLAEVAGMEQVQQRVRKARDLSSLGMERVRNSIRLQDGVALFSADGDGALINRYAPYFFHPSANYSIGAVRSEGSIKITAMRNPWRDFASANLGEFMRPFGGGGHQRVGSVILKGVRQAEADSIVARLMQELMRHYQSQTSLT